MYNRRYEKVFLMLRQETAGYAIGNRPPWGSCVMELKNGRGRLHLTMQGLKPLQYEVYVMAGEESVFCGAVIPDSKDGCCTMKWEFDPDEIGSHKAEDLHTVIVLAEGLSAPLTAYFREKRDWKTDFVPGKQKPTEEQNMSTEKTEQTQQAESTAGVEAEERKLGYHGSFQGLLAKFRQELETLEETGILSREEMGNIRKIEEQQKTAEKETKVEGFFPYSRESAPFGDGEMWKQISLEEMTLLSQIPLKWQKEFFFLLPYRKYHHLILKEQTDGIRLGLPGQFNVADAADAHAFGFHEFRNTEGEWGYWMTFLERNS